MDGASSLSSTYEATRARQSTHGLPDKVHWTQETSFRSQPYRLLHHQNGIIGKFRVRLLEAADLQRSYWSPLALGPVKHLGLSKAHGQISAFCSFGILFEHASNTSLPTATPSSAVLSEGKPAATQRWKILAVSPVVPQNNSPVWENCQFEVPLHKGAMPEDGMRIFLHVRADEEATAAEHFIPGIPSGGDSRLLGMGKVDITSLCLGEMLNGQAQVGVMDAWISISLDNINERSSNQVRGAHYDDDDDDDSTDRGKQPIQKDSPRKLPPGKSTRVGTAAANMTGRVRILVSYDPNGLDPEPNDLVALECFARRSPRRSTCRPLVPPLSPLYVLERRGPYILVEYELGRYNNNNNNNSSSNHSINKKACMRIHRNAVFCVERKNIIDATINLALLPADLWMATPIGKKTAEVVAPVVAAGRELLMPAMLSAKLVWIALRTTTLAGFSGVQAATGAMFHESAEALTGSSRHRDGHHPTYSGETSGSANERYVHL